MGMGLGELLSLLEWTWRNANEVNSKFLTPWAEKSGFVPPILMNMALLTVFAGCGIIFWFFGKRFRGITANSFVHKL